MGASPGTEEAQLSADEAKLPSLHVLVPVGHTPSVLSPDTEERELAALYDHPAPASGSRTGAFVRANMVASIDGAAWGADHRSGSINNDADFRAFRVQRALADVVLVGAGTTRAERYTPLDVPPALAPLRAAAGRGDTLELAVVTRSGAIPATLTEADRPPLIITSQLGAQALPTEIDPGRLIIQGEDEVDLRAAVRELSERGLSRILTEGGPHLLGALLSDGLVDELCLTFSPLITGLDAGRIVQGFAPSAALDVILGHLLHSNGVLLGRWSVSALG